MYQGWTPPREIERTVALRNQLVARIGRDGYMTWADSLRKYGRYPWQMPGGIVDSRILGDHIEIELDRLDAEAEADALVLADCQQCGAPNPDCFCDEIEAMCEKDRRDNEHRYCAGCDQPHELCVCAQDCDCNGAKRAQCRICNPELRQYDAEHIGPEHYRI